MASAPSQQRPFPPEQSSSSAPESNQGEAAQSKSTIQNLREGALVAEARSPRVIENENSEQYLNPPSVLALQDPNEKEIEPRHCWICLQDEGEDVSDSTEWRSPCKCKLQAHEECLLEWIADLEAPKRDDPDPVEIRCPQCKSKIQVARPRDYIVLAVDTVRDIIELLRVPAQISAVVGCLVSSSLVYGLNAVQLVFGTEDARRLLMVGSIRQGSSGVQRRYGSEWLLDKLFGTMLYSDPLLPSNSLVGWGPFVFALPLIAPALILSRTRFADSISIFLPLSVSRA
jgi:RING-variant domain